MKHLMLSIWFLVASVAVAMGQESGAKDLNRQVDLLLQRYRQSGDEEYKDRTASEILALAMRCDSMDAKENGTPQFREKNFERTYELLPVLVKAAERCERNRQSLTAMRYYKLYLQCAASDLYPAQGTQKGTVAWRLSRLALESRDFATADHYADLALLDDSSAALAAEVKMQCMEATMETKADSTRFLLAALELHAKAPDNPLYGAMLMRFLSAPGHEQELAQYACDEVRRDPSSVRAWLLKAETEMKRKAWDEAIASYTKALELGDSVVEACLNLGLCYGSKAIALNDSLKDKKGHLKRDDAKQVKETLAQAQAYLEKARMLDPERKRVDWLKPLYQVYYALKDKRAEELKALIR